MSFFPRWTKQKAQTVTELAIFGSILLFVIGAIVRQGLSFGHVQNQNLRAMRLAMTLSYIHSSGFRIGPAPIDDDAGDRSQGNASRNSASVLIVEDRLSSDSAKFGAISRSPVIASGQGTHSRNLYMPIDHEQTYDLPVYDMFINGKHFPFSMAAFKKMCFNLEGNCPAESVWYGSLFDDDSWKEGNCVLHNTIDDPEVPFTCARLYGVSVNNNSNEKWCPSGTCECTLSYCHPLYRTFDASQRFDLDRDGTRDVPPGEAEGFSWQWMLITNFNDDKRVLLDGTNASQNSLIVGEFISEGKSEWSEQTNMVLDVDNDFKEERIIRDTLRHNEAGIIQSFIVIDSQDGDLDFSYDTRDFQRYENSEPGSKPEPGLQNEVSMFTRVRPGTFLEIREGRLYDENDQFVRSVQRKDHIDIIQRVVQLSNDTGRFCNGSTVNPFLDDVPNPVEVCSIDCFATLNVTKTCFDTDDLRIYIRSRVQDSFGHQWITETSSDDYIDFVVPGL